MVKKIIFIVVGFIGLLAIIGQLQPASLEDSLTSKADTEAAEATPKTTSTATEQQTETPAENNENNPTQSEASDTAEQINSPIDLAVPDFQVSLIDGTTTSLSQLVSDKPTMVGFWASWCHNCQRNLPVQNTLFQAYKDKVNILEVNLSESRETVDRYAANANFDFLIAYDEAGTVGNAYGIQHTNTHVLIAADGSLIEAFSGDVTEEHFKKLIQ